MNSLPIQSPDQLECGYCDALIWHSQNLRRRRGGEGILDDDTDNDDFTESFHDFQSRLFHESSDKCGLCCNQTEGLCGLCRHNRLGHILRHMDDSCSITIEMGCISDIQARRDCKVCRIIIQAAERDDFIILKSDKVLLEAYRRSRWSETSLRILLAGCHSDQSELAILYLNDNLEDLRGPFVNWNCIKDWLEECDEYNQDKGDWNPWLLGSDCDPGILENPPSGFRLIDVNNLCVVQAPLSCEYAALSYVWGPLELGRGWVPAATTRNTLEMTGSLSYDRIPPTIGDAIQACSELGIRYLWIDRYCIVQDDEQMKETQIDAMDRIYSHAVLTLVAVEGEDPSHGLPGVSELRNGMLYLELVDFAMVEQVSSIPSALKRSKWFERGWTFQEAILSKRLLFFTNDEVAYECSHGRIEFEHGIQAKKPIRPSIQGRESYDYFEAIPEFSERQLSDRRDTIRAITGVLNSLHGKGHQYGLPLDIFDQAILWITACDVHSHDTNSVRDLFPSWSWSSSPTSVTYIGTDQIDPTPLATWAAVVEGPSGDLVPQIIEPRRGKDFEEYWMGESIWKQTLLAWESGLIRNAPKILFEYETGYWDSFEESWRDIRGLIPGHGFPSVLTQFTGNLRTANSPGRILVFSQCARMNLSFTEHKCGQKTIFQLVSSDKSKGVGYLCLDDMADKKLLDCSDRRMPLELLAVLLTDMFHIPKLRFNDGDERGNHPIDCSDRGRDCHAVATLLTIRSADSNVCRRIGVAEIRLDNWTELELEYRTSVLV